MYQILYIILLILRFVLTLLPQTGYIHPDEHFQYPEVVYGDLLHISSFHTWEFTCSEPIRSIAVPYVIVGIPSVILSAIGNDSLHRTTFSYLLLVLPRLVMCGLSVVHDLCLIKICRLTRENPIHKLVIFASSYVTLIFFTRTLSNSVEAVLFSLLIYLVSKDLQSKRKKVHALRTNVSVDYLIGVLVLIGCFVRPTFLLFAFAPVIFWLKSTGRLSSNIISCVQSVMWCLPGALMAATGLIAIDTVYYNDDHVLWNISHITFDVLDWVVVTPINFVCYNLDFTRVRSHGDHPRYLHFLVNLHMLFPVLGICGLIYFIKVIRAIKQRRWKWNCIEGLMFVSFISPLALLSTIPHQEPRFITPVLFPLAYLCAKDIFPRHKYRTCTILYFLANLLGAVFFGFIHQGGLSSALTSLSSEISKHSSEFGATDIIFYHTYMPPRYLMAIPNSRNDIQIHDLGGSREEVLLSKLHDVMYNVMPAPTVFIISPGTLHSSISKINDTLSSSVEITISQTFFPHFSSEDPPSINEMCKDLWKKYFVKSEEIISLSLNLYKAEVIK